MLHIFFGCYGNILVSLVTDILGYLFPISYNHPYATSMTIIGLWESILVSMTTVAMVTEFWYFSWHNDPKVYIHAKFCCDWAINTRDKSVCDP